MAQEILLKRSITIGEMFQVCYRAITQGKSGVWDEPLSKLLCECCGQLLTPSGACPDAVADWPSGDQHAAG
jgi:hypothetical protein